MSDKIPKISVCLPCRNVTKYIDDFLSCLEKQTFKDFEVVIIDDASTDKTYEILSERIKISKLDIKLHTQKKSSQGATRNKLVEIARGTYIFFFDADDRMTPKALEKLYAASQNEEIDIITGKARFIFNNFFKFCFIPHSAYRTNMSSDHYVKSNLCTIWGVLYKRSLFKNIKFLNGYIFEDIGLMTYLFLKNTKFALIKDVVYYYNRRINAKSTSSFNFSNRWSLIDLERQINYIFEKYKQEGWLKNAGKLRAINGTLFTNLIANIWLSNDYSNCTPINVLPICSLLSIIKHYGLQLKFSKTPWKIASFFYINSMPAYRKALNLIECEDFREERNKLFKNIIFINSSIRYHVTKFLPNYMYILDFQINEEELKEIYKKKLSTFMIDISQKPEKYDDVKHVLYGINMHKKEYNGISKRIYFMNMKNMTDLTENEIKLISQIDKRILVILNKQYQGIPAFSKSFNITFK